MLYEVEKDNTTTPPGASTEGIKQLYDAEKKKLHKLEKQLMIKIAETNNNELMDLVNMWQAKRAKCSEIHLKWIESILDQKTEKK
jgi:hypothetical protein